MYCAGLEETSFSHLVVKPYPSSYVPKLMTIVALSSPEIALLHSTTKQKQLIVHNSGLGLGSYTVLSKYLK